MVLTGSKLEDVATGASAGRNPRRCRRSRARAAELSTLLESAHCDEVTGTSAAPIRSPELVRRRSTTATGTGSRCGVAMMRYCARRARYAVEGLTLSSTDLSAWPETVDIAGIARSRRRGRRVRRRRFRVRRLNSSGRMNKSRPVIPMVVMARLGVVSVDGDGRTPYG